MRRNLVLIALSLVVFLVLNYAIYQKEQTKLHGQTVFLELAPVDPRSLMQGDFMRLSYTIERDALKLSYRPSDPRGYLVIRPDETNVARVVRFDVGTALAEGELRLKYSRNPRGIKLVPDSFFFQEGEAKKYENAKYGVFKFDDSGTPLLVGLQDGL
ncbi:GDYXXLXY domain-containing protein [Kiloniella laminariae]|uniref:GDYXXLXY domain-containing protein n=1 Tax=Kiloniella laminariae TaxID=454162 RepID=UPI000369FCE5|nr:GDYXXLXY domain-containing protein [Kiloniella laminariae]